MQDHSQILRALKRLSQPLKGSHDLDPLMERIGEARIVMLGEASHGTHEYYTWRSLISQRLIREKGFNLIAVEGDWPDCYKINRYIKGYAESGKNAREVLQNFDRWPTWMWANWEIIALTEWLRKHNDQHPSHKTGFYGLDVYSLWDSLNEIIDYLEQIDPQTAHLARQSANCFENYSAGDNGQTYAWATRLYPENCEKDVVKMLQEIRQKAPTYDHDAEAAFNTEQNALIAANAEKYYREMGKGSGKSWNVRDRHMTETLERLLEHFGAESKVVVWEHNTHIGDARATPMRSRGLVNIGQLIREKYKPSEVVLVGFGSYTGSVIAGKEWGAPMQEMSVPDAKEDSWEELLHENAPHDQLLVFDQDTEFTAVPHRAIGVVYDPTYETYGNYVSSDLHYRYDAFIYIDKSKALHPLHIRPHGGQEPDTFPFGV